MRIEIAKRQTLTPSSQRKMRLLYVLVGHDRVRASSDSLAVTRRRGHQASSVCPATAVIVAKARGCSAVQACGSPRSTRYDGGVADRRSTPERARCGHRRRGDMRPRARRVLNCCNVTARPAELSCRPGDRAIADVKSSRIPEFGVAAIRRAVPVRAMRNNTYGRFVQ